MSLELEQSHVSLDVQPLSKPLPSRKGGSPNRGGSNNKAANKQHQQKEAAAATPADTDTTVDTSFGSRSSNHTALFIRDNSLDGGGVETSRITVNTHNSILNITEEEDDEEGSEIPIETSFLLDPDGALHGDDDDHLSVVSDDRSQPQFQCIPQTPPACRSSWKSSWCEHPVVSSSSHTHEMATPNNHNNPNHHKSTTTTTPTTTTSPSEQVAAMKEASLLDFLDGLCSAGNKPLSVPTEQDAALVWEQYRRVLEYDIMELLGCSNPPDQDEIHRVWQFNLTTAASSADCHACAMPGAGAATACSSTTPPLGTSTSSPGRGGVGEDQQQQHQQQQQQRRSRRRQWRERAMYVHRLRMERSSSPSSVVIPTSKCRSMDDRLWSNHATSSSSSSSSYSQYYNPLGSTAWSSAFGLFGGSTTTPSSATTTTVGPGLDPTLLYSQDGGEATTGYDSDPEERTALVLNQQQSSNRRRGSSNKNNKTSNPSSRSIGSPDSTTGEHSESYNPATGSDTTNNDSNNNMFDMVQETLNMSWTVTWYPRKKAGDDATSSSNNNNMADPRPVQIWIERGTLIEMNTVMLEPNLMWRETFHPELETKRKLNKSSQKPHYIRLLNLCRVLTPDSLDKSRYPLVRPACGILIRTSDGQEHVFETKTREEREDLVRRWKLTTARFATLAVLEDLETICREFFSPMVTSRMLVPDYGKLETDDSGAAAALDEDCMSSPAIEQELEE